MSLSPCLSVNEVTDTSCYLQLIQISAYWTKVLQINNWQNLTQLLYTLHKCGPWLPQPNKLIGYQWTVNESAFSIRWVLQVLGSRDSYIGKHIGASLAGYRSNVWDLQPCFLFHQCSAFTCVAEHAVQPGFRVQRGGTSWDTLCIQCNAPQRGTHKHRPNWKHTEQKRGWYMSWYVQMFYQEQKKERKA